MMKRQLIVVLVFVLTVLSSRAQDIIIKTDSTKVFCKIIKEDDRLISFRDHKTKSDPVQTIEKTDVLKYYNSSSLFIAKNGKLDTMIEAMDKIQYGSLALLKGDTIYQDRSGEYIFRQGLLRNKEVIDLMSHDSFAYKEIKKACHSREGSFAVASIGASLAA